jgi:hypothetical protein
MADLDLYERIKNADITETSKNLFYQIEKKGSTSHRIIGSIKQHLHLYSFSSEDAGLHSHITYEQFRKKDPKEFKIHMQVLQECINAGFKI